MKATKVNGQADKKVTTLKVLTNESNEKKNADEIKTPEVETPVDGEPKGNEPGAKEALRAKLKGALTVEGLTNWVEDMDYLRKGRAKLIEDAAQLRDFEVMQRDEPAKVDTNYWNGCQIEVKDDTRRSYTLRNPVMIAAVIKFLYEAFDARKEEIDNQILEKATAYPF